MLVTNITNDILFVYICFHGSAHHCFRSSTYERPVSTNPIFKTPIYSNPRFEVVSQIRCASQARTRDKDFKFNFGPAGGGQYWEDDKETQVIYSDPISIVLKIVRVVRVMNLWTCCGLVISYSILNLLTFPDFILPGGVNGSAILIGFLFNAGFRWLDRHRIHKIRWQPGSDSFEVEMLAPRVKSIRKSFNFYDIDVYRPSGTSIPELVLFEVDGCHYFFLTKYCHNKAFLASLYSDF